MAIQHLSLSGFRYWLVMCICLAIGLFPNQGHTNPSGFQNKIWPEHLPLVTQAKQRLKNWYQHADLSDAEVDALDLIKRVLAAQPRAVNQATLIGNWRVRSLQGGSYGLFLYPYFKASIRADGENRVWFEKTTGSQRRSGHLYADGTRWVFLGTSTVNEEPQGIYRAKTARGTAENESVGVLWQLSANHLVMLLDTQEEQFEIYELQR